MILEFDLKINGETFSYPFHFGMSTVRTFATKKGWQADSLIKITDRFFGGSASLQDQLDFMMYALKAGLAYTNSKLPIPADTDVFDQYYSIYPFFQKEFQDNLSVFAKNAGIVLEEGKQGKPEEPGKS